MNLTIEEKSREHTKTKAGLSDRVATWWGILILETDKNPLLVTAQCLLATTQMSSETQSWFLK